MVLQSQRVTVQSFEAFIAKPENQGRNFELLRGEIIEVTSNPYSSEIAGLIIFFIHLFLRENKIKGHVTVPDGGYIVNDERYIPDVAYISAAKQATMPYNQGYNTLPPELAVEVLSPSDAATNVRVKVANYLAAGTVVWVVNPPVKEIEVYVPGQSVVVYAESDTLDGAPVLPGFKLPVAEVFPAQDEPSA
ncbi:MAG: Uma2 family endonuclease [Chloroflexota bacterium]